MSLNHFDFDDLIQELVEIGGASRDNKLDNGPFLNGGNNRARQIGQSLNQLGGMELMLAARGAVRSRLGGTAAQELEVAWGGIGEWEQ